MVWGGLSQVIRGSANPPTLQLESTLSQHWTDIVILNIKVPTYPHSNCNEALTLSHWTLMYPPTHPTFNCGTIAISTLNIEHQAPMHWTFNWTPSQHSKYCCLIILSTLFQYVIKLLSIPLHMIGWKSKCLQIFLTNIYLWQRFFTLFIPRHFNALGNILLGSFYLGGS